MKTIVTNPPMVTQKSLGFIKDQPTEKPAGKDIGELVAGKREVVPENRRKAVTRRGRPSD